ncbi:M13 family metallopeptidase [Mycoplasma sp. 3398]
MNKAKIKENFFEAINGEWLNKHKIADNKTSVGTFERLDESLTRLKTKLITKWSIDSSEITENKILLEMVKFYNLVNNWNDRKKHSIKPIIPILKEIESYQSWNDIENNYTSLCLRNFEVPIPFFIHTDFKNHEKQTLFVSTPSVILPEKSYYSDEEKKNSFYRIWVNMVKKMLLKVNNDEKWANDLVNKALLWDNEASKYILSAQEWAIITNIYHPRKVDDFNKKIKEINLSNILNSLINDGISEVICVSKDLVDNYSKLLTKENFELYKAFLYISSLIELSRLLDYESLVISGEFSRALSGQRKPFSKKKIAVKFVVDNVFSMPFGKYYGETYFGPQNKKNVEQMIHKMVKIYEDRLKENTWLSKQTKDKAILKLSKIGVYVGYPEIIEDFYKEFIVQKYNGYDDLITNALNFTMAVQKAKFAEYGKKKDINLWSMSPAIINAYYNPSSNKIVFPAGILQSPFYSSKQSSSSNYGGIGAVIAHEISHAFDNNGANFDEVGNMVNWWTEDDKKEFNKRAEKMVKLFDNKKTEVGKCDGRLTVSENIADAGGLSCALEAAKSEKDYNPKHFYINYAITWRSKQRPELQKLLLASDVHAPAILRTNIQVQNSDDFYKTFKISESDQMFLNPKKRVKIW